MTFIVLNENLWAKRRKSVFTLVLERGLVPTHSLRDARLLRTSSGFWLS